MSCTASLNVYPVISTQLAASLTYTPLGSNGRVKLGDSIQIEVCLDNDSVTASTGGTIGPGARARLKKGSEIEAFYSCHTAECHPTGAGA